MIARQRGLEYKNNPQEDMATLLEYEAKVSKVMQVLLTSGISAEQICEVIDEEDEAKEELLAGLHEKIFEQQDCGTDDLDKQIKNKRKELQAKKDELKQKELEIKASKRKAKATPSNASTSTSEEENQEWELVDDLEQKAADLKEAKDTLEDTVKTLEGDLKAKKQESKGPSFHRMKEQKSLLKEHKPVELVVGFALDSCRNAFLEYIAEKERDALNGIFESFKNNVKAPITAFANMTEQARQVFEQDVSSMSPPRSKALGAADRGLAVEEGR
eukprot:Skav227840  [mRNA]  locus=scaffold752:19362:20986:- [translate_table: standard]